MYQRDVKKTSRRLGPAGQPIFTGRAVAIPESIAAAELKKVGAVLNGEPLPEAGQQFELKIK